MADLLNPCTIILDMRGLLMHSMFTGKDPDALLNDAGEQVPTAAYGFGIFLERYLNDLVAQVPPRQIIGCWDDQSEFRLSLFPEYKKARREREKDPIIEEQLKTLIEYAQRFMAYIGCTQAKVKGVEADDLIALLVKQLPNNKMVYTVDGDLTQLSSESCAVFLQGKVVTGDYQGVPFNLIAMHKALVGDTSDGYGGLKGFGPVKWGELVEAFGFDGVEELQALVVADNQAEFQKIIADNGDAPGTALLKKIDEGWDQVRLMYTLAILHPELCDQAANFEMRRPIWYRRVPNADKALGLLADVGASKDCEHYRPHFSTTKLITQANANELPAFVAMMSESPIVTFDYESYDVLEHEPFKRASKSKRYVDTLSQSVTGASFTCGPNLQHTIYIATDHADTDNLPDSVIQQLLVEAQKRSTLVVHNAMFEIPVSVRNFGSVLIDEPIDTRLMGSYVDENTPNSLKDLSLSVLGYTQATYQETLDAAGVDNMAQISGVDVLDYGADDAICTAHLFDLFATIMHVEGTWDFFQKYERAPNNVLSNSFLEGWPIDQDLLKEQSEADQVVIDEGMARVRELLSEHATKASPDAVANFMTADAPYLRMACSEKAEKSGKDVETHWSELEKKFLEQSVYHPLVSYQKPVDFKPTDKQLNEVISALGFEQRLASVAASRIAEFAVATSDEVLSAKQSQFVDLLSEASGEIKKREGDAYAKLHAFCADVLLANQPEVQEGDELNFGSPQQMQALFYLKLGFPVRVNTRPAKGSKRDVNSMNGSPATNERAVALAMIYDTKEGDWRREVLEQYQKVKAAITRFSFYYLPYPLWKHPMDGNVHGSIMNCGTVTRRPSGSSPNFLQVAKGPIRRAFHGKDDELVVAIDFNGQELRITGSESRDPVMMDAYLGEVKKDIHSVTGAKIAVPVAQYLDPGALSRLPIEGGVMPYDEFFAIAKGKIEHADAKLVDKMRAQAKIVNFLICYLGTPQSLALKLGVPIEFAEELMAQVFASFARLSPWQEEVIEFARRHGYTQTAYGTRRHLSKALFSQDNSERRRIERQAVNFTIQGCAADILKIVLTEYKRREIAAKTGAKGVIPVYDEIAARVPEVNAVDYIGCMSEIMAITPPGHPIPMVPEVKIGRNWGTMIELGTNPSEDAITQAVQHLDEAQTEDAAVVTRDEMEADLEDAA